MSPLVASSPEAQQPVEIAVVDYGMGNRRSVEKALQHVGARALVSSDPRRLSAAAGLVVPGVGAFPRAMQRLRELELDRLLRERLAQGTPVLGICLGMQLAFERSSELGGADGLGVVPGEVRPLPGDPGARALKLPHIGWNEVSFAGASERSPREGAAAGERSRDGAAARARSPLLDGLPQRCAFYHVHSFAAVPAERRDVLGSAEYGAPFVTAVQRGCFYGVQFHPEKSSAAGLRLLANFARICIAADARAPSAHGSDAPPDELGRPASPPPVLR